jgi:hypothetical protein
LEVNPLLRERHEIAINILARLNLDNIWIEQAPDGHYVVWKAWSKPIAETNGHAAMPKHGKLRISTR